MSQDLDLSRRAVAAGWKWQAGALDETGYRAISEVGDGLWQLGRRDCMGNLSARPMLPDFRDAATRGVLLQQVRERRNAPHGYVTCGRSRCASQDYAPGVWDWYWAFWDDQETFVASGDSETAALVAALEAAPKEKGL